MAYVEQRIETARHAMEAAQDAANAESKSSAGDKYETTRAMMQIERDRHAAQLTEALKLKRELEQLNIDRIHEKAQPGSIVCTDTNRFFLAISAGRIACDGYDYFVVSIASPIGAQLYKRGAGDTFVFNQQSIGITEVY